MRQAAELEGAAIFLVASGYKCRLLIFERLRTGPLARLRAREAPVRSGSACLFASGAGEGGEGDGRVEELLGVNDTCIKYGRLPRVLAMRFVQFDTHAPKQTVSVTINSDLYAQARKLGVNTSQVAEQALIAEVARRRADVLKKEIRQDLEACKAYEARYGSFAEMVRDHYQAPEE